MRIKMSSNRHNMGYKDGENMFEIRIVVKKKILLK